MKALVYLGPNRLEWRDWQEPVLGANDALVAVRAVGICGSDLHGYTGESGRRTPPIVMGHEFTGQVLAVGRNASQEWVGKRVAVQPIIFCGTCDQCCAGHRNRCRQRRFIGGNVNGAMAERVVVPTANLFPLPDQIGFTHGTLIEPLAVAWHAAHVAGDLRGKSVLICGSGPIGLLTLIATKRAGARSVVLTEPLATRRALALKLGADAALDPGNSTWRAQLTQAINADEVDVAFDAVGIEATFWQGVESVRPGGIVVALGGWKTIPVDMARLVGREIQIRGTFNFTPEEFANVLCWLKQRCFDFTLLVTDEYSLAEGAQVFARLIHHPADSIKVVLTV